ncbi:hypothetical protein ACFPN0_09625 [Kitasatospora cinereorecta]
MGTAADGVEQPGTGLVKPTITHGRQVGVTLTPNAGRWLNADGERNRLEALTGLPVRNTPRLPAEPRPHPTRLRNSAERRRAALRVVMEILGHSQIVVTMNIYARVVQDTSARP